jgi:hypothetical protein
MTDTLLAFFHANPTLTAMLLVVILGGSGYLELRVFPEAPMLAGTSWLMGLLILCAALSGLPMSGWSGALFVAVWVGLGITGMLRFFKGRTSN